MSQKVSKGVAAIFAINIILVVAAICLFIFLALFTYTITLARIQTISKSRDSLIPLVLSNLRFLDNRNLAVALAINKDSTQTEIENSINKLTDMNIESTQTTGPSDLGTGEIPSTICYFYTIGDVKIESIGFNCKCTYLSKPSRCTKYSFRTVFPFPQVFDGDSFVVESTFTSFV